MLGLTRTRSFRQFTLQQSSVVHSTFNNIKTCVFNNAINKINRRLIHTSSSLNTRYAIAVDSSQLSRHAFDECIEKLVNHEEDEVVLVSVVDWAKSSLAGDDAENIGSPLDPNAFKNSLESKLPKLQSMLRDRLALYETILDKTDIQYQSVGGVEFNAPAHILKVCDNLNVDVLVLGSHGGGTVRRMLNALHLSYGLGSTVMYCLTHANCMVNIVPTAKAIEKPEE